MLVLKTVCTECATINDNDAKFCKHCGVGSHDRKIDTTELATSNPYAFRPSKYPDRGSSRCLSCDRLMFSKTCFFCQPVAVYA